MRPGPLRRLPSFPLLLVRLAAGGRFLFGSVPNRNDQRDGRYDVGPYANGDSYPIFRFNGFHLQSVRMWALGVIPLPIIILADPPLVTIEVARWEGII